MNSAKPEGTTFHVMAKPTGPICNLDCTYCFYLEKENLYHHKTDWQMADDVLESFIRQKIASNQNPAELFAWQGGELTLLGVDFFRKVVALQQKYAHGKEIVNAFQTNGVLLNDKWCAFFAENNFLVGISIDGPKELHDKYRVNKGGKPTFDQVMRGVTLLKKHHVEFNTLTVVQEHNSHYPLEVYHFLKEIGSGFMQFIPIVERIAKVTPANRLNLVLPNYHEESKVSAWSVEPTQFGNFLITLILL